MKKVYSTREEYLPGYPIKDGGGWYTTVEDDEFETYFEQGKIFEKDGLYYSDVQQLNKKPEKPANSGMFDDPGSKIKSIVTVLFIIGCVFSVIAGIAAGAAADMMGGFSIMSFILTTAVGVFSSYVGCLLIAAIGDIAVNTRELNRKTK